MNNRVNSIRIRVQPIEQNQNIAKQSPREQFWALLKRNEQYSEKSISFLENRLVRKFGGALRERLVENIIQGIRSTERAMYGGKLENILDDYRHFFHEYFFRGGKEAFPYSYDPISKLIDLRQQIFREVPGIQAALNRLALVSDITFSVRIEGYKSLNFLVDIGGQIEKLAQVFDSNFDSFRVFLEVFVPPAFGDVYDEDMSEQMVFEIDPSESIRNNFTRTSTSIPCPHTQTQPSQASSLSKNESVQRAEWLRQLVNGTLVFPVLLTLIVGYFGFKEIAAFRSIQDEALKPILEHHIQLLKEDRERLIINQTIQPAAKPIPINISANPIDQNQIANPSQVNQQINRTTP